MRTKHYCHVCGTRLTKKLFEERERLFCPQCQYPVYENPLPATAAVVMNENHEVLLVKRSVDPKAGQWCLPGGFVEMGEAPEQACLRELKEETGLEGEIHRWAGNIISESPVYQWVIVMGYSIKNVRGRLTAGDDCSEAVYFNPGALPTIAFRSHREILKNVIEMNEKLLQGELKNEGWKARRLEGEKVRTSKVRLKASKQYTSTNFHELNNIRHSNAFTVDTVHLKKPSVGPKGLIGTPCHGAPGCRRPKE